jgi:hypothetical protein
MLINLTLSSQSYSPISDAKFRMNSWDLEPQAARLHLPCQCESTAGEPPAVSGR